MEQVLQRLILQDRQAQQDRKDRKDRQEQMAQTAQTAQMEPVFHLQLIMEMEHLL